MKKTTKKKLSLSRETIANLESLQQVEGGIVPSDNKACTFSAVVTACANC